MEQLIHLLQNPYVVSVVAGVAVSGIIHVLKKIQALPSDSTGFLRFVAALFAVISTVILRETGHDILDPSLWSGLMQAGYLYGVSYLTHASVFSNPNNK